MFSRRKPPPIALVRDPDEGAERGVVDGRGVLGAEGQRGLIDGRGVYPAGSAAEGQRGLIDEALAYADELYGLARHLCATASDAEDLVQDTYARALGGAARLVPGSNLRAWLFRILRNGFIDQARRKQIVLELPDDTVEDHSVHAVWDAAALDQLRYLAAADLERALATLPHELRMIVLLDAHGFHEAEIAEIARCAPGTVKSRLSRARARLRAVLQGGAR